MRYFKKAIAFTIIALAYFFLFWMIPPAMEGDFTDSKKILMFHIIIIGGVGGISLVIWAFGELLNR